MDYKSEWENVEIEYDSEHKHKSDVNGKILPNICLSDLYVFQMWLDYAKGIGDPSSCYFRSKDIIYHEIFEIAQSRKKMFGDIF